MSIVPFAYDGAGHRIENPGSLTTGPFVEVAWILFENRRHNRASNKRRSENVGISCPVALPVSLRTLPVVMPAISGLVNSSQNADPGKRDRVGRRFPGKLE